MSYQVIARKWRPKTFDEVVGWETINMLTVARLVAMCAAERTESIGVHYRVDSLTPDQHALYHLAVTRNPDGTSVSRGL